MIACVKSWKEGSFKAKVDYNTCFRAAFGKLFLIKKMFYEPC